MGVLGASTIRLSFKDGRGARITHDAANRGYSIVVLKLKRRQSDMRRHLIKLVLARPLKVNLPIGGFLPPERQPVQAEVLMHDQALLEERGQLGLLA